MKSFIDNMNEYSSQYSVTENGAIAYKTSGKKLTDFNFKISYYRNHPEEAKNDFCDLMENCESMETIARYVFYIGDIREGLGERNLFKICLKEFLKYLDEERIEKILHFVPEYNRWDSLWKTIADNEELFIHVLSIINNQLLFDLNNQERGESVSLIAKWLPSENASSEETKQMARKIYHGLHLTSKEYRVVLSTLRKYIDVTERKMSLNQWNEIEYKNVPSKANLLYSDSFLRHDAERRKAYIESLKKGKTKINSSVLYPYEIVDKYTSYYLECTEYNEIYEQMWKSLPKLNIKNTLVVRDGSGSMCARVGNTTPLSVATSLSIYLSENNSDKWKNKFITFSSRPQIIDLSNCKTLQDKLNKTYKSSDCSNTNIYATMRLVLDTAIKNNVKQEEMPEMILIISDMQFDGHLFNMSGSLFDNIKMQFECAGYKLPKICFWNVAGDYSNTIPLKENEYGLVLCSGFSINIVKMFLSGEIDPYKILLDTINSKRYDPIGNIFCE